MLEEVETIVSFKFCNLRMAGGWYNSVAIGRDAAVRNKEILIFPTQQNKQAGTAIIIIHNLQ